MVVESRHPCLVPDPGRRIFSVSFRIESCVFMFGMYPSISIFMSVLIRDGS